jgi:hypothetical protein
LNLLLRGQDSLAQSTRQIASLLNFVAEGLLQGLVLRTAEGLRREREK